jgi:hypothetical protein
VAESLLDDPRVAALTLESEELDNVANPRNDG